MKRWLWKFFGKWVVIYNDSGRMSRPMSYRAALEYSQIFNGVVEPEYLFRWSFEDCDDSHLT
jgi:hypothetical protein